MEANAETKVNRYQITVKGPNKEAEKMYVTPESSAMVLREHVMVFPKFMEYTTFHFEVENPNGGENLLLDPQAPFSEVPVIGDGSTIVLVPELYDMNTIRYQIKHSIALLANKLPLISQLVQLNNDPLPASLKEYKEKLAEATKQSEEKKENVPIQLTTRVDPSLNVEDATFAPVVEKVLKKNDELDLGAFLALHDAVNKEVPVAIKSLSISSYNPPNDSQRAVGDLIYLRVVMSFGLNVDGDCREQSVPYHWKRERLLREHVY